ncbi:unnamed protein product, partial [Larinioides sclopetarius]
MPKPSATRRGVSLRAFVAARSKDSSSKLFKAWDHHSHECVGLSACTSM